MDHFPAFQFGLIQVAGVHDAAEAAMLLEEGADLIGLPLRLPVNTEDLSEAEAAVLSRRFPGKCCLITYASEPGEIAALSRDLGVDVVQLHGEADPAALPELRRLLPRTALIKSLIIGKGTEAGLLDTVRAFAPHVSAFITDTFDPSTGAEGATGLTHDWSVSRRLRVASPRPVILAGGLDPGNVAEAIAAVRPFAVDVHTGVEGPDGRKDRNRVRAFVKHARQAFGRAARGGAGA